MIIENSLTKERVDTEPKNTLNNWRQIMTVKTILLKRLKALDSEIMEHRNFHLQKRVYRINVEDCTHDGKYNLITHRIQNTSIKESHRIFGTMTEDELPTYFGQFDMDALVVFNVNNHDTLYNETIQRLIYNNENVLLYLENLPHENKPYTGEVQLEDNVIELFKTTRGKLGWFPDDDELSRCNRTNIFVGGKTGFMDITGEEIHTNHILVDVTSREVCVVSAMVWSGVVDYGLSNFHCSHCPFTTSLLIIGIKDSYLGIDICYIKREYI